MIFCSWNTGIARENLQVIREIHDVRDEILGLVEGLPILGPYLLSNDIGMGVAYLTLILYLRKGICEDHLHWDIIIKPTTSWINLYE